MACRAILPRLPLRPLILASSASSSPFTISSRPPSHSLRAFRCHVRSEAKLETVTQSEEDTCTSKPWKIKMLYDGDCPLCMREVNMLKERNKLYGAIKFVDISSEDYSPEENQGLDYKTAMGRIHAILSDGAVVRDVEVARIANAIYSVWAKYRLQITGRPPLEDILESRQKKRAEACSDDKICKM
ncbi:uncharacterized protein At5g50100, chloroplastic isoform X2 [Phoenix dactylifera]|uniref:Uncharacterized protein At5g50100, chloroplastic isoform X2 n=1 Tax=Phoenix dactylifera TaxID=42345 RepID=A0A8B9AV85_PHODC|nr:uncharacterized protein At5g50100, chloroplastic isoform X2 [Phoenix dactylifera]